MRYNYIGSWINIEITSVFCNRFYIFGRDRAYVLSGYFQKIIPASQGTGICSSNHFNSNTFCFIFPIWLFTFYKVVEFIRIDELQRVFYSTYNIFFLS